MDTANPRASKPKPGAGAGGVRPGANVSVTFSEAMKDATVNKTTFKLTRKGTAVGAAVSYNAATRKATLNPRNKLTSGAIYTVTVSTGARDLAGNVLDQNPSVAGNQGARWSFKVRR